MSLRKRNARVWEGHNPYFTSLNIDLRFLENCAAGCNLSVVGLVLSSTCRKLVLVVRFFAIVSLSINREMTYGTSDCHV